MSVDVAVNGVCERESGEFVCVCVCVCVCECVCERMHACVCACMCVKETERYVQVCNTRPTRHELPSP